MMKLTVAFHNFANTSKMNYIISRVTNTEQPK